MHATVLFFATFTTVFALGLQSLNVNRGHQVLAVFNSLVIGSANLVILKLASQPTDWLEICAYLFGGPIGILAAMRSHHRIVAWLEKQKSRFSQKDAL